jgi:hypothetical protein
MQVVSAPIGKEHVHFEAPPAAKVDQEMAGFLGWFNKAPDIDEVLKAALAHLWFVTIHPFDDGNGRIARDRRYGTSPIGEEFTAVLQHVCANSARARSVLRHP